MFAAWQSNRLQTRKAAHWQAVLPVTRSRGMSPVLHHHVWHPFLCTCSDACKTAVVALRKAFVSLECAGDMRTCQAACPFPTESRWGRKLWDLFGNSTSPECDCTYRFFALRVNWRACDRRALLSDMFHMCFVLFHVRSRFFCSSHMSNANLSCVVCS